MQKTVQLYIGGNNTTHKVEVDKLKKVLNKYHEGYTIERANIGAWHGVEEESVKVLISDDYDKIIDTVNKLKYELKQDAIAVQEVAPLEFI